MGSALATTTELTIKTNAAARARSGSLNRRLFLIFTLFIGWILLLGWGDLGGGDKEMEVRLLGTCFWQEKVEAVFGVEKRKLSACNNLESYL
jgi:hypothetical protein